jgi:hypothetical protein
LLEPKWHIVKWATHGFWKLPHKTTLLRQVVANLTTSRITKKITTINLIWTWHYIYIYISCNEPFWLTYHPKKLKLLMIPKIKVSIGGGWCASMLGGSQFFVRTSRFQFLHHVTRTWLVYYYYYYVGWWEPTKVSIFLIFPNTLGFQIRWFLHIQ